MNVRLKVQAVRLLARLNVRIREAYRSSDRKGQLRKLIRVKPHAVARLERRSTVARQQLAARQRDILVQKELL